MSMRTVLFASLIAVGAIAACGSDQTGTSHIKALTGAACEPNAATFMPRSGPKPNPGQGQGNGQGNGQGGGNSCVGTSNGDNCDDVHSGKIDCIGDGNSGQGDDKKHMCQFPQPGCDDQGCCDGDVVVIPPDDGDEVPPPPPPESPPIP
jgi:hypothetical protein